MKAEEASNPVRKTERQYVDEKLQHLKSYLKYADLSPVYEALEKNKTNVKER